MGDEKCMTFYFWNLLWRPRLEENVAELRMHLRHNYDELEVGRVADREMTTNSFKLESFAFEVSGPKNLKAYFDILRKEYARPDMLCNNDVGGYDDIENVLKEIYGGSAHLRGVSGFKVDGKKAIDNNFNLIEYGFWKFFRG